MGGLGFLIVLLIFTFIEFLNPVKPFEGNHRVFGSLKHEIYYREGFDPGEVTHLGENLIKLGYFSEEGQMTCQIKDSGDAYILSIPSYKDAWKDEEFLKKCKDIKDNLNGSTGFKKKIKMILIDFDGLKQIEKEI